MIFGKSEDKNVNALELRNLLGFIDKSTNFDVWRTWLQLSERDVKEIVGREVWARAEDFYNNENILVTENANFVTDTSGAVIRVNSDDTITLKLLRLLQLANALFAFVKIIPSLDAQHSNVGRKRTVGETERALTAVEAFKDEENILHLAYNALDEAILFCEENKIIEWIDSNIKKETRMLLVPSVEIFNRVYKISSVRMYYSVIQIIREVQDRFIVPIVGRERTNNILELIQLDEFPENQLVVLWKNYIIRPVVLKTMTLVLERFPVEALPEGLVQLNIIGNIKEKRIASEEARKNMLAALNRDADSALGSLLTQIEIMDTPPGQKVDIEVVLPKYNCKIKGFVF
ncbi:MAG: hypothetical protein LBB41_02305 [Prevotellaceae bacterium]|jgi:hypothetical protein|nr:hypothetical protein [Prevotellaceae bacterium]